MRAPPGPEKSPRSTTSPPTSTTSVEVVPAICSEASTRAARSRTVVVLPFVPVTSSTGMSWTLLQSTSAGSGRERADQVSDPLPSPTETARSSERRATPWAAALAWRARRTGLASRAISSRSRAAAVRKSGASRPVTAASHAQSLISVAE